MTKKTTFYGAILAQAKSHLASLQKSRSQFDGYDFIDVETQKQSLKKDIYWLERLVALETECAKLQEQLNTK